MSARAARDRIQHVAFRTVDELSDQQIEMLLSFGDRQARLLEDLEAAVRSDDKDLAWQISRAIVDLFEAGERVTKKE